MAKLWIALSGIAALATGWAFCFAAHALPISASVVHGSANFQVVGPVLNISLLSPSVVINWSSFSVGPGEIVRIAAPPGHGVLNRVVGGNPSMIFGDIFANVASPANFGLINHSGIHAGSLSSILTGDVLLSTPNVLDADFIAQAANFTGFAYQWTGTEGPLILDGSVDATAHSMYLAATTVSGTGILRGDTIFIDTLPVSSQVPVPSSLALLLTGLGVIPIVLRRSRRPGAP